ATGSENPQEVQDKIDRDPQVKAQLQKDLAEIAFEEAKEQDRAREEAQQIDLELYRLEAEERERQREQEFRQYLRDLQDRQDARAMQGKLADDHSPLAWVAPILAFMLIALIFYLLRGIMIAREEFVNKDVFNVVLGALVSAFTAVVSYYFGSSVGSRQKDDALRSGKLMPNPEITAGRGGLFPSPPTVGGGMMPGPASDGGIAPMSPTASPPPSGRLGLFRQKAPGIIRDLMRDLGLTNLQASGILGNIGVECAGFQSFQEERPLSGRGGWGWCQWTGTRRRAFEQWANERHLDLKSDAANYGFLLQELQREFAGSVRSLKQTQTVEAATTDFMNTFEKPDPRYAGLSRRIGLAQLALREHGRAYNV
ncbi:MAG TPA: phage tail tip lysozyme, partial [Methylocella sp.]|nr:phage tail tip lysozyme [Methylocella sp.]